MEGKGGVGVGFGEGVCLTQDFSLLKWMTAPKTFNQFETVDPTPHSPRNPCFQPLHSMSPAMPGRQTKS